MKKNMEQEQYGMDLNITACDRVVLWIRIWDPQH